MVLTVIVIQNLLVVSAQETPLYKFRIKSIEIKGNRVTHESIIYRELEFSLGDSLSAPEIINAFRNSENNLRNTYLFNFVKINYRIGGFNVSVTIDLSERWYIWPAPILEIGERNLPAWLKDPELDELNYGSFLNWNNFRGRKELLQFKFRFGYKEHFMLKYVTSNLDKNKKHGLIFNINKFRQQEIILRNENDRPVYFSTDQKFIYESVSSTITYTFRPHLYSLHSLTFGYNEHLFRNDENRMEFLGVDEGKLKYTDLGYVFEYDVRDYKIYPLAGRLFRAGFYRQGLGIFQSFAEEKNYLTFTASNNSHLGSKFYSENATKIRFTRDENLPNIFEMALGYETYLRGFEYYTINGNSYYILLNSLKYELMAPRTYHLPSIPWQQFSRTHFAFYLNLFFDMAWVDGNFNLENGNDLPNRLLYSTGLGLDLVSYYDQVLRLECTLNSLGKPGLYLHLETPFRRW